MILETVFYFGDALSICHLSIHESAATRFLHHLGAIVARDLAKRLGAVHDRKVHNLGVGQQETTVGCKGKKIYSQIQDYERIELNAN